MGIHEKRGGKCEEETGNDPAQAQLTNQIYLPEPPPDPAEQIMPLGIGKFSPIQRSTSSQYLPSPLFPSPVHLTLQSNHSSVQSAFSPIRVALAPESV